MSARAPFVPQRPASRTTTGQNDKTSSVSTTGDFFRSTPGENMKDNQASLIAGEQSSFPQSINKPLNLSGLIKKKPSQQSASNRARRPSDENTNPHVLNQQALRLNNARPTSPFFPNNSGFVPLSSSRIGPGTNGFSFGAPSDISNVGITAEFSSNKAHIVSSATIGGIPSQESGVPVSLGGPGDGARFPAALHPTAALGRAPSRSSLAPSLEKIQETVEVEDMGGPYGPWDGGLGSEKPQHALRRTNKRIQQGGEDDELEYGSVAKRFKGDATNEFDGAAYSRGSSLPFEPQEAEQAQFPMLPGRQSEPAYNIADQGSQVERQGAALRRILGQDLDAFVDARYESYEQAKHKWAECSMEEWKAGADEMTDKFGQMLDFVKAHMTLKVALYSELHSTVATHRNILAEREKTLNDARDSLVRDGANVVSGKNGVPASDSGKAKTDA